MSTKLALGRCFFIALSTFGFSLGCGAGGAPGGSGGELGPADLPLQPPPSDLPGHSTGPNPIGSVVPHVPPAPPALPGAQLMAGGPYKLFVGDFSTQKFTIERPL